MQQEMGYMMDSFAVEASRLIREKIAHPTAAVHFVSSGTHANVVCLASMLRPYESIIAADTGHANIHEAGAIEAAGHKINAVPGIDGKLTAEAIEQVVALHIDEHMVVPRVVYISQATELGTIYSEKELTDISNACKRHALYLFVDGARLGAALASAKADVNLPMLAKLADIFYIGGTKNGALIGEAIVITNPVLQENFRHHLRQRGALLAKGRAVSLQFLELFKDTLYFDLARHANEMAQKLAAGITAAGHQLLVEPAVNQIFVSLPNILIEQLKLRYGFHLWAKTDKDNSLVRFVTSWATEEEAVDQFIKDLNG